MFHLNYSRSRDFLTWEELRCLSRSLGFQVDLFPSNVNHEIKYDDRGLQIQEVYRSLEYKLLHKPLHLTYNIHTDTWNVAALKKAVSLVEHKAFTFEQLHCIRVAYQLYENQDSKGMLLQQKVILRALKMCGRTIAPLKLMHRLKHMKGAFVEPGRIQLDEFLDLILWCDRYVEFDPGDLEYSRGKDKDLFKLVAFDRMLTHHDERLSERLNAEYLAEEWDFGQETLGSKRMSKEPPVNDQMRLRQVQRQKEAFKPLKSEVEHSQQRVYRSRVGFIRPRPLTAPELSRFGQTTASSKETSGDTMALSVYEFLQRHRKKSPPSADGPLARQRTPFQPTVNKTRTPMTPVVTLQDIAEASSKLDDVTFQMETLEGRYKYEMDKDMDFLLPTYKPRPLEETEAAVETLPPEPEIKTSPVKSRKARLDLLVHPRPHTSVCHSRTCDARHRGWYAANTKTGHHYILSSPTHQHSQCLRGNYLHRHVSADSPSNGAEKSRRPATAPSTAPSSSTRHSVMSRPTDPRVAEDIAADLEDTQISATAQITSPAEAVADGEDTMTIPVTTLQNDEPTGDRTVDGLYHLSMAEEKSFHDLDTGDEDEAALTQPESVPKSPAQHPTTPMKKGLASDISLPVPYMKHSRPAVVKVGHMGKISLLENIAESRFYESVIDESGGKQAEMVKTRETLNQNNGCASKGITDLRDESVHENRAENGELTTGEGTGGDLKGSKAKMCERQTKLDADKDDFEDEEGQKLRAIAMLRIYTHRLATRHKGGRRKGSPRAKGQRKYTLSAGSAPRGERPGGGACKPVTRCSQKLPPTAIHPSHRKMIGV